jgi:hypothetical protein
LRCSKRERTPILLIDSAAQESANASAPSARHPHNSSHPDRCFDKPGAPTAPRASRSPTAADGSELQEQTSKVRWSSYGAPTPCQYDPSQCSPGSARGPPAGRSGRPHPGAKRKLPALVDRSPRRALGCMRRFRRVGPRLAHGEALLGLQHPMHHQQLAHQSSSAWLAACQSGSVTALTSSAWVSPPSSGSSAAGPPSSPSQATPCPSKHGPGRR